MIIYDFQNAVAEDVEDEFPELLDGPNNGVIIAKPKENVSFRPPAIILRFRYSGMTPAPGRLSKETVQKNIETGVGERTTWQPYNFPFSIGFRHNSVKKMHEWWERLYSKWGKHLILNGVPVDHQGFNEPVQDGIHAITLNYNTWVNLKGHTEQQYLVEEYETELVHNNDIEVVKVTDDEVSDSG